MGYRAARTGDWAERMVTAIAKGAGMTRPQAYLAFPSDNVSGFGNDPYPFVSTGVGTGGSIIMGRLKESWLSNLTGGSNPCTFDVDTSVVGGASVLKLVGGGTASETQLGLYHMQTWNPITQREPFITGTDCLRLGMAFRFKPVTMPTGGSLQYYFGGYSIGGIAGEPAKTFRPVIVCNTTSGISATGNNKTYTITSSPTTNGQTPTVLVIGTHGFQVGDPVTIASMTGNTAPNGSRTVSAITSTSISVVVTSNGTYNANSGNATYTGGLGIASPTTPVVGTWYDAAAWYTDVVGNDVRTNMVISVNGETPSSKFGILAGGMSAEQSMIWMFGPNTTTPVRFDVKQMLLVYEAL